MPMQLPKLMSSRGMLISLLILALLLTGCGESLSLDVNFDGGGETGGMSNSTLFMVLIVVLIGILAVVVVGRR